MLQMRPVVRRDLYAPPDDVWAYPFPVVVRPDCLQLPAGLVGTAPPPARDSPRTAPLPGKSHSRVASARRGREQVVREA